ncbi:WD repeat domain 25 [Cricetulus griseus]
MASLVAYDDSDSETETEPTRSVNSEGQMDDASAVTRSSGMGFASGTVAVTKEGAQHTGDQRLPLARIWRSHPGSCPSQRLQWPSKDPDAAFSISKPPHPSWMSRAPAGHVPLAAACLKSVKSAWDARSSSSHTQSEAESTAGNASSSQRKRGEDCVVPYTPKRLRQLQAQNPEDGGKDKEPPGPPAGYAPAPLRVPPTVSEFIQPYLNSQHRETKVPKRVLFHLRGHRGPVNSIQWCPVFRKSHMLLSASMDKTFKLESGGRAVIVLLFTERLQDLYHLVTQLECILHRFPWGHLRAVPVPPIRQVPPCHPPHLSLKPEVNWRVMNIYAGSTGLGDAAERCSVRQLIRPFPNTCDIFLVWRDERSTLLDGQSKHIEVLRVPQASSRCHVVIISRGQRISYHCTSQAAEEEEVWNAVDSGHCLQTYSVHSEAVRAARWSPCGRRILSGGFDFALHLTDLETGTQVFSGRSDFRVTTLKFHPKDHNVFLCGGFSSEIKAWDMRTGKKLLVLQMVTFASNTSYKCLSHLALLYASIIYLLFFRLRVSRGSYSFTCYYHDTISVTTDNTVATATIFSTTTNTVTTATISSTSTVVITTTTISTISTITTTITISITTTTVSTITTIITITTITTTTVSTIFTTTTVSTITTITTISTITTVSTISTNTIVITTTTTTTTITNNVATTTTFSNTPNTAITTTMSTTTTIVTTITISTSKTGVTITTIFTTTTTKNTIVTNTTITTTNNNTVVSVTITTTTVSNVVPTTIISNTTTSNTTPKPRSGEGDKAPRAECGRVGIAGQKPPSPRPVLLSQERYTCPSLALHPREPVFLAQSNGNYLALFSSVWPYRMSRRRRYEGHKVEGYAVGCECSPCGDLLVTGSADGRVLMFSFRTARRACTLQGHAQACLGTTYHPVLPSVLGTCSWGGDIKIWH